MVHGTPYVPPSYEEARCFAALERRDATEPLPDHWQVATPREALERTLRHEAVQELMMMALEDFDVVPISFRYGALDGPPPEVGIPYRLDGTGQEGEVYVLVRRSDLTTLRVQVGRQVPTVPGVTRIDLDEDGLLMEWRRSQNGWDSGTVLERWNRVPGPSGRR